MGDGNRSRVLVTGESGRTGRRAARTPTARIASANAVTGDLALRFPHVCGPGMAEKVSTGAWLPARNVPAQPGETPAVIVDISRARLIGFTPEHDLKSGLATVWPEFAEAAQ